MHECDIYLLVDTEGASTVGDSEQACRDRYEEDHGALNECGGFRIINVRVTAALPVAVEKTLVVDGDTATVTV